MNDLCPKGHVSTDPEFCSECGASMKAGAALVGVVPKLDAAPSTSGETCPDCMTARRPGARYCEMCRYDFATRTSFGGLAASEAPFQPAPAADAMTNAQPAPVSLPVAATSSAAVATDADPAAAHVASSPASPLNGSAPADLTGTGIGMAMAAPRLKLRIVVDPSLYVEPAPDLPCPVDTPEKVFHLDLDENTLGRQYEGKGIHPEIVIHDPGISRRHLKFVRSAAGVFSVLELGSSNGTLFNRATLEPGVETIVKPSDELTLGMWTRIYVEAR